MLTWSAMPASTSAATESPKLCDTPNRIVANPKPPTAASRATPARRIGGNAIRIRPMPTVPASSDAASSP